MCTGYGVASFAKRSGDEDALDQAGGLCVGRNCWFSLLVIEVVGYRVRPDCVVRNRKYCTRVRDLVGLLMAG